MNITINETKLSSTLAGIIGLLAVIGPRLLNMLGAPTNHWASLGVQIFGAIVLACTTGQAIGFLNKFLPVPPTNTAAVVPLAPMQTDPNPATGRSRIASFPQVSEEDITQNIKKGPTP